MALMLHISKRKNMEQPHSQEMNLSSKKSFKINLEGILFNSMEINLCFYQGEVKTNTITLIRELIFLESELMCLTFTKV